MLYQVVKSQSKKESVKFKTLNEAVKYLLSLGCRYEGRSYVGGFPIYAETYGAGIKRKFYSIQGYIEIGSDKRGVMCSLPNKEAEALDEKGGQL